MPDGKFNLFKHPKNRESKRNKIPNPVGFVWTKAECVCFSTMTISSSVILLYALHSTPYLCSALLFHSTLSSPIPISLRLFSPLLLPLLIYLRLLSPRRSSLRPFSPLFLPPLISSRLLSALFFSLRLFAPLLSCYFLCTTLFFPPLLF